MYRIILIYSNSQRMNEDHIEIEINFIPNDNFNKFKLYFDLVIYYSINNIVIKYKGKIFYNEKELKYFFKNNSKFCNI